MPLLRSQFATVLALLELSWLAFSLVDPGDSSPAPDNPFDPTVPPGFCPCNQTAEHVRLKQAQKALKTHELINNKTSWIARLHHRATHSREALSASLNLGFLLSLVVIGVLATRMWADKAHRAIQQRQPVQFDSHSVTSEILVKDMLKKRARTFVDMFDRLKKRRSRSAPPPIASLRMETFLNEGAPMEAHSDVDEADSASILHQRILLSDSSSSGLSLLDSSEEDDALGEAASVYSLNSRTGEWGGSRKKERRRGSPVGVASWAESAMALFRRRAPSRGRSRGNVRYSPVNAGMGQEDEVRLLAETSSDEDDAREGALRSFKME